MKFKFQNIVVIGILAFLAWQIFRPKRFVEVTEEVTENSNQFIGGKKQLIGGFEYAVFKRGRPAFLQRTRARQYPINYKYACC